MTQVADTLAERGARYGDFTDHAAIAQSLQGVMHGTCNVSTNWSELTPVKKQALTVIADKIARILSGDPEYKDNWHDIQGYAKLAEDRCVIAPPAVASADNTDGWIEWADRYKNNSTHMPEFPAGAGNRTIEVETNAGVRTRGRHPEFDWQRIFGPYAIARWRFVK